MKFPLVIVASLAVCGSLCAQTQDRKMLDRMLKPDMDLGNPLQTKEFNPGGSMELRAASYSSRGFDPSKQANIKEFAFTRSFLGIKNPWFGNKVFETGTPGDWQQKSMWGADKTVDVRTAPATAFYDSEKPANLGNSIVPVQPFEARGAAQGAVSQVTDKISEKMTIDEVRELLNKNR